MVVDYSKKPPRGSMPQPDHIFISINGDAKTSMTVTWRTSVDVESGYALCRKDGTSDYMRFDAETDVFESDIDVSNMFWAHMVGLEPATRYFYTVGNDEYRSEEFSFITEDPNAESFKFIAISDHQKGTPHHLPDYSKLNKFLKDVLKENPDTKFILTAGDNTDCGMHEVQWNGAFEGLKGIIENIPYMMEVGNHDTRGFKDYEKGIGRFYSEPAVFFCKQFKGSYPYNGPDGWKTETYAFDYGNAHFSVIAVNGPEDVNEWMCKDLPTCGKIWKFGSYHFPIYYAGPELSNDDAYPVMREGMEQLDILFSGHEHNFSRTFPMKNESMYDRPSQGTIHYELANSHFNPPGTATVKKVWHAAYFPSAEDIATVAIVEVFKDKVILTSKTNDGRILDQCIVDKANDRILPYACAPYFRRPRVFFKGAQLGIGERQNWAENKDGVWYSPLAIMFSSICAEVVKEKGKVTLGVFGKKATFFEGSDIAVTADGEEIKLPGVVYRAGDPERQELFIPVDAVRLCFDMKWNYAENNNFISVETAKEAIPFTVQP